MEEINKKINEIKNGIFVHNYLEIYCIIILSIFLLIIQLDTVKIHILSISNWSIYLDPIGFILPVIICIFLIMGRHMHMRFILISLIPVSLMSYLMTMPVLEKGIVSPFPLWLFPPIMVGIIVILNKKLLREHLYSYAFILGVFGVIIGADLAHLPTLLNYTSTYSMQAIFGGAGVFDLIMLSGLFSVLFLQIITMIQKFEKLTISKDFFI